MTASAYLPDTGDLIWTDFDPSMGREQAGRRPALVVSPASFTENTGLAVVCPITSRVRPFPTSVVLPASLPIAGEILISHIRSIDTHARPIRYAGAAVSAQVAQAGSGEAQHLHHDLSVRVERAKPSLRNRKIGPTALAQNRAQASAALI
jgi:mRNA interferase MazF